VKEKISLLPGKKIRSRSSFGKSNRFIDELFALSATSELKDCKGLSSSSSDLYFSQRLRHD
jgi:hypothetical protein